MKLKSLGFIGGGRVTKIFLQALANKNAEFESIIIYDTNTETLNALKANFPEIILADTVSKAAKQEIVFIALHPPVIMETLDKISGDISTRTTIISLAPKINHEKIKVKLPTTKKIVRVIPNATSYINEGYNPVYFPEDFPSGEKQELLVLLGLLGHTFEVSENKLESYAIMSAMLPTYFWFQWRELIEIGQKTGLNEMECVEAIYETLNASLDLMYKSELSPEKVIDLIPVKPIAEHEQQIIEIYKTKLLGLFEKIKP
jgi:pyrroline-5-carboxylate reductase